MQALSNSPPLPARDNFSRLLGPAPQEGQLLEIAHVRRLGLAQRHVHAARLLAHRLGVTADRALLSLRLIDETSFYRALAEELRVPFLEGPAEIAGGVDDVAAVAAGVAPLRGHASGARWLYAPQGRAILALRTMPGPHDFLITTPRRFNELLRQARADTIAREASVTVAAVEPRLSALYGPSRSALMLWGALAGALGLAAHISAGGALRFVLALLTIIFCVATVFRLLAVAASGYERAEPAPLCDHDLPFYTLIIALYREASVADALVRAIERIDYPRAKLEVKFVVECDDVETAHALAASIRGVEYEIIVAPEGQPRTKPRALNVALRSAQGEIVAVYDAEDAPEPDQLRRAAALFAAGPANLACLQARLDIDNAQENWLTAYFAADYAALFETINPGQGVMGMPIALGGTSNHFRADILRALGGWDAWNVTEDADLGMRLARCGYRVETFGSRTFEEAPTRIKPFLAQRVRWLKGRFQTAFVHGREPRALLRNLGPCAFLSVFGSSMANLLGPLVGPVCVVIALYDAYAGFLLKQGGWIGLMISTLTLWLMIFGLTAMFICPVIGLLRQKKARLLPVLFLAPVWYGLLSIAAWRALYEVFRKPFYWAKTEHGHGRRQRQESRRLSA